MGAPYIYDISRLRVKFLGLICASEDYGVVKFCAMPYPLWAGCRVVFAYNSTYEKLDDNITGSTRYLTYSRWWRMTMKFRPLEPRASYSQDNLGVLQILFPVCESL